MYRQGDLLIVPVERDQFPKEPRLVKSGVVQEGEATGHAHRIEGGGAAYNGGFFLKSDGTARLVHDEHDTIVLPEGFFQVLRQREYNEDGGWSDVWD